MLLACPHKRPTVYKANNQEQLWEKFKLGLDNL